MREVLLQGMEMRTVALFVDGIDEASGRRGEHGGGYWCGGWCGVEGGGHWRCQLAVVVCGRAVALHLERGAS